MNDARYYQRKRKAEHAKVLASTPKKKISEDTWVGIYLSVGFLVIIVILFVMLANALSEERIICEEQGGEFHSTTAGKVVITKCEIEEGNR